MTTREDYDMFFAEVRKKTGLDAMTPDADGLVSISVDSKFNMNFQYIEPTGKVLCFVEVAALPGGAGREVYRALLSGALFGKETAGGFFSLEPATEIVVYNYFFDLEEAARDVPRFIETVEKIVELCDMWSERINSLLHEESAARSLA